MPGDLPRASLRGGRPPRRLRGRARAGRAEPGLIGGNWEPARNRPSARLAGVERYLPRRLLASHTLLRAEPEIGPRTWAEGRYLERTEWPGGRSVVSG